MLTSTPPQTESGMNAQSFYTALFMNIDLYIPTNASCGSEGSKGQALFGITDFLFPNIECSWTATEIQPANAVAQSNQSKAAAHISTVPAKSYR